MLALLGAFGGSLRRLDFQKLLFLYCQEIEENPPYDFVPYQYGAFSFTSYYDRRKLIARGLLANCQDWTLTEEGNRIMQQECNNHTVEFARNNTKRGSALLAETYRRFPYYAINSTMMASVSYVDDSISGMVDSERPITNPGTLFTIGYQSRTLDAYLNSLIRAGITLLCDVRRNPISRKYGFSKRTLSSSCQCIGIRYEHLPNLGIRSDRRKQLNTHADYDALFTEYRTRSLPCHEKEIATILGWLETGESVTLTCFESLHEQCHRHCVADAVESRLATRLAITHL